MPKRRSVIFVHGIGDQQKGYSNALFEILTGEDEAAKEEIHPYEVFYPYVHDAMNEKAKIDELVEQFSKNQNIGDIVKNTVTHVLYFPIVKDANTWITTNFKEQLLIAIEDSLEAGFSNADHDISVISHSLGTFVAYEVLHKIKECKTYGVFNQVRIKNLFTLASPLQLIKTIDNKLRKLRKLKLAIVNDIEKPSVVDNVTKNQIRYVKRWYSFRHIKDPVASLDPLEGDFLDKPPLEFDKIHEGNAHAFKNYMIEFKDFILAKILEDC